MMKQLFSIIALLFVVSSAKALELPSVLGDNMMLQQKTQAKLWGWAKNGSLVEVTTSWNGDQYTTHADRRSGRWELKVHTPEASFQTYSITVKGDGETKVVNNVLVGEIWFCSGQSNMEMPLAGFWNCPVEGSNEAIATSGKYSHAIRVLTIPKRDDVKPRRRVPGHWEICEPQNAPRFSAVGFFFARTLHELLNVPVGIINCSWGGSCVEGWLPREILETYPDGLTPCSDADYHRKMVMYNGMLHPLMGYTVRGFLWNQGESNVGREKEYFERFQTMANYWRWLWDQGDDPLPFYTVELPGYCYSGVDNDEAARFREVQHKIAHTLENCGCVSTSDLVYDYEPEQIHATQKLQIGQRLAYMAAVRDYGLQGLQGECPEFEKMETVNKNEVLLFFSNCADGFDRLSGIEGFVACGTDGIFHPATVSATNTDTRPCLRLVCNDVTEIKHVRYCFKNFVRGQFHNSRQLPIVPFRTDDF